MQSIVTMPYAVFCSRKNNNRAIDKPCLDPLDFGKEPEPNPELLLRRGRVAIFPSREEAENALRATGKALAGQAFTKNFSFIILECRELDDANGSNEVSSELG